MTALRVAVIGAGAFGRNHLRVYRELEAAAPADLSLTAAVDPDAAVRDAVASTYGIPVFASVADLLAADLDLRAASVCVPTVHHACVSEELLRGGLDLLIEKPIAASREQAASITALAGSLGRIVQVGHLERFNPAVTALAQHVNRPMFFECHRLSIFTPRALDVDVVLDLMIHDLDVVLSLARSPAREVRAVGLPVLSGKTDIANARVEFESGCVANFTASRVSTERVRKLRLFQPQQYLSLDFARQELFTIDVDRTQLGGARNASGSPMPPAHALPVTTSSQSEQALNIHAQMPSSRPESSQSGDAVERPALLSGAPMTHPSPGLSLHKFDLPRAEPLRLEIEDFIHAVRHRTAPRVSAEAGSAALDLALSINEEISTHARRAGL